MALMIRDYLPAGDLSNIIHAPGNFVGLEALKKVEAQAKPLIDDSRMAQPKPRDSINPHRLVVTLRLYSLTAYGPNNLRTFVDLGCQRVSTSLSLILTFLHLMM